MKISILTLFPQMFAGIFDHSILKLAQQKKQVEIKLIDIRSFGIGKHKSVDDKPYGGGHGMILRVDVVAKAIEYAKQKKLSKKEEKIILLDARGQTFNQQSAIQFSQLKHLILVCGHYEGVDERIKKYVDQIFSIGNFVLTGGEIPAMIITDATVRLIKGVLKENVTKNESFSPFLSYYDTYLEHPQYTRPPEFNNQKVPQILISGDHKKILDWKQKNAL